MKTYNTILNNIKLDNDIKRYMKKNEYFSYEDFVMNAKRYIKAIKQGRVICSISKVSNSGMSRNIKFLECNGSLKTGFRYYNFYNLFCSLGYTNVKDTDTFRISGCGMDMIFHTNYVIIRALYRFGFISKKECAKLEQMTPSVI